MNEVSRNCGDVRIQTFLFEGRYHADILRNGVLVYTTEGTTDSRSAEMKAYDWLQNNDE